LPINYGLASNKLISKAATNEMKQNGQYKIPLGIEKSSLLPSRVAEIPPVRVETTCS